MSSYYSEAQLEKMRQEKLRQELADNIRALKKQMKNRAENRVYAAEGGIILTTADQDIGTETILERQAEDVRWSHEKEEARRQKDFSGLLADIARQKTPLEKQLDLWIGRIPERAILTERDRREKTQLLRRLKELENDEDMNMESRLNWTKQWIETYLESGELVSEIDMEALEEQRLEYYALCEMMDMTPTKTLPEEIRQENSRIFRILEKRKQNQYIMDTLTEIMGECGCHVKEEDIMEGRAGQFFSVEGSPLCDVFVGNRGGSVLFMPVAAGGEMPEGRAEREMTVRNADSICEMYAEVEERAATAGIYLRRERFLPFVLEGEVSDSDRQEPAENRKKKQNNKQEKSMNFGREGIR